MTDPRTAVTDARRIRALWTGLLLAPVAFLGSLEFGYLLVHRSCLGDSLLPVHAVHAAFLLLALAGSFVAWRSWRADGVERQSSADGQVARHRFLAGLGVMMSALFVLSLIALWIPSFALHPCQ